MKIKDFFGYIKKYKDIIYIIFIVILIIVISSQRSRIETLQSDFDRQVNNIKTMTEQITGYTDEIGRMNAEKHAYQLTQEELMDSIGLLKKKNMEYLSYINANMSIKDTVIIETVITEKMNINIDDGIITMEDTKEFGKSSRDIAMTIPYTVKDNELYTKDATLTLNQDIFVEGWLERNTKTDETYVHLRSDYPGLVFNSGLGIVAESGSSYERSMRKNCGIGLSVGPNIGLGYDLSNKKIVPVIGIGVTLGFNFTPKWAQW